MNTRIKEIKNSAVFKKADLILLAILAALAVLAVIFALRPAGAYVEIYVDGQLYERVALSEEKTIALEHNTVVISGGEAYMSESDCPDQLCVAAAPISRDGEAIICLPNRVVVKITGGDSEVDAIT